VIDPAHLFARATFDLLMVVHDRQLPAPMSLHWLGHELHVQVQPANYLRYLDALVDVDRAVTRRDGRAHYRATGALRGATDTRIRLVSVVLEAVAA